MSEVTLGEVAAIHGGGRLKLSGRDFVQHGVPAYGAAGVNGFVKAVEYERDGVILSSIGARCGKCFFAQGRWTSLSNTQLILPDSTRVDSRFLWHQLNDESRWHRSGSAQPFIKPSDVKTHKVWLPSLHEQRRITAALDQIDDLNTALGRLTELQTELVRSLFEDTRSLSPASRSVTIADVAVVSGGKRLPKGSEYAESPTAHPYIRVVDLSDGEIQVAALKYLTPDVHRTISRYVVTEGDIVISIAGSIGLVAPVMRDLANANLTENAARIRPRHVREYHPVWLASLLTSPEMQDQIASHVGQVTIGKLALFRIEKLAFDMPPLDVQETFVRRIENLRSYQRVAKRRSREVQDLRSSTRARAFAGLL